MTMEQASESARKHVEEEYKSTVFYRTFIFLISFYISGNACIDIFLQLWPDMPATSQEVNPFMEW